MFSYDNTILKSGIDIDLHDVRGKEKHWVVAIENSRVVWVKDEDLDDDKKEACILLESESMVGIYYMYNHLYNKNIKVSVGDKLVRGEVLGTTWGDSLWGHLNLSVVKSDKLPTYETKVSSLSPSIASIPIYKFGSFSSSELPTTYLRKTFDD